jgi:hypothetical protein
MRVGQPRRLGHGLEHAGFVIGGLDRDEHALPCRLLQAPVEPGEVHDAVAVKRDMFDDLRRETVAVEHTRMLACAGQEAHGAAAPAARVQAGREHRIGRLGAAARENDVLWLGSDQPRNPVAGRFQFGAGRPALRVDGGRIAGQERGSGDGFRHLRPHRSRGVMVEIAAGRLTHAFSAHALTTRSSRKSCIRANLPC